MNEFVFCARITLDIMMIDVAINLAGVNTKSHFTRLVYPKIVNKANLHILRLNIITSLKLLLQSTSKQNIETIVSVSISLASRVTGLLLE